MKSLKELKVEYSFNTPIIRCPTCHKEKGSALWNKLKKELGSPKYIEDSLCEECEEKYLKIVEVQSEEKKIPTGRRIFIHRKAIAKQYKNYRILLVPPQVYSDLQEEILKR